MRLAVSVVALFFFGTCSLNAEETVTIEKGHGLAGLWQIEVPESFGLNIFQSTHFGPMRPIYCRVEETNDIYCLSGGYSARGSVTLDGSAVHIAWGTAMVRVLIDANVTGDGFAGAFVFKFFGISHCAPTQSVSKRFNDDFTGDVAGEDQEKLEAEFKNSLPQSFANFGPIKQIAYLGTSPYLDGNDGSDYFHVYALEFENVERVCAMHGDAPLKCI